MTNIAEQQLDTNLKEVGASEIGYQRVWFWRGWQVRYTFLPPRSVDATGMPIIFLHGFGAAIEHWRYNLPFFAQHHPVYALDLLGFGASEKAFTQYQTDLWVEQVVDFWHTLVQQPVVLVGNSLGSLVSMAVAAAHPEIVQGIVMLNLPDASVMTAFLPKPAQTSLAWIGQAAQPLLRSLKTLFTLPPLFNPFFGVLRQRSIVKSWAKSAYANPDRVTDELVEIFAQPAYDSGADRALRAMINSDVIGSFPAKTVLPQLQMPLLLIWGKQDKWVPPSLGPTCVRCNPHINLVELDQAGHCPHDEVPDRVNALIQGWLNHLSSTPPGAHPSAE